jgi:hypothetical protein
MERLELEKWLEPTQTLQNDPKQIYNTYSNSLPKIFTKTTQIKTKIKKSSLKNYSVMSLPREVK